MRWSLSNISLTGVLLGLTDFWPKHIDPSEIDHWVEASQKKIAKFCWSGLSGPRSAFSPDMSTLEIEVSFEQAEGILCFMLTIGYDVNHYGDLDHPKKSWTEYVMDEALLATYLTES